MSKQTNIQTKDEEIIEERQIFNDAEEIITLACKDIEHQKKLKSFLLLLIPLFIFAILVGILSTVFALINRDNETIFSGISIQGIDVSNLTIDEAKRKVSSIIGNHISEEISLQHNDFQTVILIIFFFSHGNNTAFTYILYSALESTRNNNFFHVQNL